jgi:hypothetical protein
VIGIAAVLGPVPAAAPDEHSENPLFNWRILGIEPEYLLFIQGTCTSSPTVAASVSWCHLSCGRPNQLEGRRRLATSCSAKKTSIASTMAEALPEVVTHASSTNARIPRVGTQSHAAMRALSGASYRYSDAISRRSAPASPTGAPDPGVRTLSDRSRRPADDGPRVTLTI